MSPAVIKDDPKQLFIAGAWEDAEYGN